MRACRYNASQMHLTKVHCMKALPPSGIFPFFGVWASLSPNWTSPMAQQVKNPPAMQETQETQVQSQGREDPLEKKMATHSSILAWKIP